eukprot:TRINITY_DN6364_c0_g1_i1.p1 TRINITY_DN6364_c0_g1~~TRINITY_DN6364_c0_g1_i1.p1  ORF type:complete len:490 (+),score=104.01 TRINITY_DN6364_c0_g1_i1:56-1525(+)
MGPPPVKRITQDTFDSVVKENIDDFDMTPEEAIADAVSQFESQGVDLSTISKTYGDGNRPILDTIPRIQAALTAKDDEAVSEGIRQLISEVKSNDDKQLAGSNNAVQVISDALVQFEKQPDRLLEPLSLMATLLTWRYNRDVLMDTGMRILLQIADVYSPSNQAILEKALACLRNAQLKDENNRQDLFRNGLLDRAESYLTTHIEQPKVIRLACDVIRAAASNDDERAPLGKAAERARHVVEHGAIIHCLELVRTHLPDSGPVASAVYAMLSKIIVTNEMCDAFLEAEGMETIFATIDKHGSEEDVVKNAVALCKTLAGSDDVKNVMVSRGYIPMLVQILRQHMNHPAVVERVLGAFNFVSLRNQSACAKIADAGGLSEILTAMKIHSSALNVQQHACMAIRNLVVRNPENKKPLLDDGAEELCNLAMQAESNRDHAKAALRDLGCKVEFVELWKDKAVPDSMKDPTDTSNMGNGANQGSSGIAPAKVL